MATSCEELTHWKILWCWEGLGAGGEADDRGWDSWMASLTRWTWVWMNSGSWSWTGSPGMLLFMGLQRVGHNWATELNWTYLMSRKDLDAGKVWRQEEKGMTEDEMVGWPHWLDGHELEQASGDGEQGSLVCCSPWGHKESETTEWLNNNNKLITYSRLLHAFSTK